MSSTRKTLPTTLVALAGFLVLAWTNGLAGEKIAEQEGIECATCHGKPGSKRLNDKGKYYETLRTLDGYAELIATFGRCTHCHVGKPGSRKLTKAGKRLSVVVNDMKEVREWVKRYHPTPPLPQGVDR